MKEYKHKCTEIRYRASPLRTMNVPVWLEIKAVCMATLQVVCEHSFHLLASGHKSRCHGTII